MPNIFQHIKQSLVSIFKVWRQEFRNVFKSIGVLIFFLGLPTGYPIVYSLIYNKELAREIPVVVIDNSRTPLSREFVRNLDATQNVNIKGYAADLPEAQKAMHEKECYGILLLPTDFDKNIGRGEQANAVMYCDMSLLMRYKSILSAITDTGMEMGTKIQARSISSAVSYVPEGANPIPSFSYAMGDTEQGLASFLLPGILVLILQQSMVLGVCMLGGAENERRLKNNGQDPSSVKTGIFNTMIGKSLCYFMLYIPSTVYILYFVPRFFYFPQFGDAGEIFLFMVPFLFACAFFGMTLQVFVKEREDVFPVIVFTSLLFLFLSGLTWPRYAMGWFWKVLSDLIPATWGVEGFIKMNGNGASLAQTAHPYLWLWGLTIGYFIMAYIIYRFVDHRKMGKKLE